MTDMTTQTPWPSTSPLAGAHVVNTIATSGATHVTLTELPPGATVLVMARRQRGADAIAALQSAFALQPPAMPGRVTDGRVAIVWSGPGQWLVTSAEADAAGFAKAVSDRVGAAASCSDQSDARVVLRLSGDGARRTLMKVVGIDVHPTAFPVGAAAMTPVAHMPCHLWRCADANGAPVFEIAGARSTAGSLWHALVAAAAELGLEARPLQPAEAK